MTGYGRKGRRGDKGNPKLLSGKNGWVTVSFNETKNARMPH